MVDVPRAILQPRSIVDSYSCSPMHTSQRILFVAYRTAPCNVNKRGENVDTSGRHMMLMSLIVHSHPTESFIACATHVVHRRAPRVASAGRQSPCPAAQLGAWQQPAAIVQGCSLGPDSDNRRLPQTYVADGARDPQPVLRRRVLQRLLVGHLLPLPAWAAYTA